MSNYDTSPLKGHYESYKKAVVAQALPGTVAMSRTLTPIPDNPHESYYQWLEILGKNIFSAVEEHSVTDYFSAITAHKDALLECLHVIAGIRILDDPDSDNHFGISWDLFRYSGFKGLDIKFKEWESITVIPFYGEHLREIWDKDGKLLFDVDEIVLLESLNWEEQKKFMLSKKDSPRCKILSVGSDPVPLAKINTPLRLGDWKLLGVQF